VPTYTYRWYQHEQDEFHGVREMLAGTGCGVMFEGSGFYETDYKRKETT